MARPKPPVVLEDELLNDELIYEKRQVRTCVGYKEGMNCTKTIYGFKGEQEMSDMSAYTGRPVEARSKSDEGSKQNMKPNQKITAYAIAIATAFILIYDIWALIHGGINSTISAVIWEQSHSHPAIPFF